MPYLIPSKLVLSPALLTQEGVKALNQQYNEMERKNGAHYDAIMKAYREMLTLAVSVYGAQSKVHRYLLSNAPDAPPSITVKRGRAKTIWQKDLEKIQQFQVDEHRRAKQRAYRQRRKAEIEAAVKALESAGYVLGEHFGRNEAPRFAAEVLVEVAPGVYGNRMLPAPKGGE